jgi:hypothetical protein
MVSNPVFAGFFVLTQCAVRCKFALGPVCYTIRVIACLQEVTNGFVIGIQKHHPVVAHKPARQQRSAQKSASRDF